MRNLLCILMICLLGACGADDVTQSGADASDATSVPDTGERDAHGADAPDMDPADGSAAADPTICDVFGALCESAAVTSPTLGEMIVIAPSSGLPPAVMSQQSHNNLDALFFKGRMWVAFRTAPDHFASASTVLYVVSSTDMTSWRFEGRFSLDTDLREPQLVEHDGELLFYFAVLGTNALDFEPQGVRMTTYRGPGDWDALETVFHDGFIPWRIKEMLGHTAVLGYVGGENIYDLDGEPIRVQWLDTPDGKNWQPVVPGHATVLEGGSSETDAVFLDSGDLIAVSRNEAGDESGFGMKICRAGADELWTWSCKNDPRKYDSPLLFRQGGTVYLIGRRNLTETGHYDLGDDEKSLADQSVSYQLNYWTNPKRCSLWTVDPDELTVSFVLDLPSSGDTCFPEIVRLTDTRVLVFNYTSPVDQAPDDEPTWIEGQKGPTLIYAIALDLP